MRVKFFGRKFVIFLLSSSILFYNASLNSEVENKVSNIVTFSEKDNYILGPGDVLNIIFYGINDFSRNYPINQEGYIYLPELRYFKAKGYTLIELKKKLLEEFDEFLVNPDIELIISEYRDINVYITGEVREPGLYKFNGGNISALLSQRQNESDKNNSQYPKLFDAISKADGINPKADLTDIKVIRENSLGNGGGKIKANINFLKLVFDGDQSQNIRIFDGDIINIPKSDRVLKDEFLKINRSNLSPEFMTVYLTGNIVTKGPVKLKQGSGLVQAIASTGGKKLFTGNVEFIRFNNDGSVTKSLFKYQPNAALNTVRNPILIDGDVINVKRTKLGKTAEFFQELSSPILSGYGLYEIIQDSIN